MRIYQVISRSLSRHQFDFLGFRRAKFIGSQLPQCSHLDAIRGFCTATQQSSSNPVASSDRVSGIVDEIMNLTLLETVDLTELMRKMPGINDMPVMAVMPGQGIGLGMGMGMGLKSGVQKAGGGGATKAKGEEKAAEKTAFDLKLEAGFDAGSKIKIIKEVRTFTALGLKEAKELVEKAPTLLKKGVSKEEADKIIEKMKELGAKVIME